MRKKISERPSVEELETELKRVRYRSRYQSVLRSTVYTLITVAAVAVLVATLWLPVLQIYGSSMTPTLQDGEIVFSVKTSDLQSGDIVAFYYNNKILIKRVIATPGDYLWIESDGTVFVNGTELIEPYIQTKALGECDITFPYQVPENAFFMMGDQRETSIDSRSSVIGCISADHTIGKILCKFWPLSEFEWLG